MHKLAWTHIIPLLRLILNRYLSGPWMSETHSNLWVRPRAAGQTLVDITPQSAGWQYIGFTVYRLSAGETVALQSVPRERCIVVLSGIVTVHSGESLWREIGQRKSVFEDLPPYAVYL